MEINPVLQAAALPGASPVAQQALQQLAGATQPGDVLSAVVVRSTPAGSLVQLQGVDVMLPLPGLPPGTALILQAQPATSGLLLELLSQQPPAQANQATDSFVPSADANADKSQAAGSREPNTAQRPPAANESLSRTQPGSAFQIQTPALQLSGEEFQTIAQRLRVPDTPAARAATETLLQYRQPVNAESIRDIVQVARQIESGLPPARDGQELLQRTIQSLKPGGETILAPAGPVTPEFTQAVRTAVIARSAELPTSPSLLRAVEQTVTAPAALQDQIQMTEVALQRIAAAPEFQALPAAMRESVGELQAGLRQLHVAVAQLAQGAHIIETLYPESVAVMQETQQVLQALTGEALRQDPLLPRLDAVISALMKELPDAARLPAPAPDAALQARAVQTLDQLLQSPPAKIDAAVAEWIRSLANAKSGVPAKVEMQQVLARALDMEAAQLDRNELLTALRGGHDESRGVMDRLHLVRMLNLTPQAAESRAGFLEIPIYMGAQQATAFLSVLRRRKERSEDDREPEGDEFTVAIRLELDKVDEVTGLLSWLTGKLKVGFQVIDDGLRKLFAAHTATLEEKLTAMGFDSKVSVHVAPPKQDATLPPFQPPPAAPRDRRLDMEA